MSLSEDATAQLAWYREIDKQRALQAAQDLLASAQTMLAAIEADKDIAWWADHSQGVVYSALKLDRQIQRLHTADVVQRTIAEADT